MLINHFRVLWVSKTPAIVIGLMLGRTSAAVKSKANEPGVSMRQDNQSRYRRRKK